MNLSGPSSYLAFIHCYSTNDIGFPAISSRSWVFVKLSLNKRIFQNVLPIILEGNRPIVQAAILLPLQNFQMNHSTDVLWNIKSVMNNVRYIVYTAYYLFAVYAICIDVFTLSFNIVLNNQFCKQLSSIICNDLRQIDNPFFRQFQTTYKMLTINNSASFLLDFTKMVKMA